MYFDLETISLDVLSILDETNGQINGLNLYMYCGDNPIMRVDTNGNAWYDILAWIGVGLFAVIFMSYERPILIQRCIEIIRIIFGG